VCKDVLLIMFPLGCEVCGIIKAKVNIANFHHIPFLAAAINELQD